MNVSDSRYVVIVGTLDTKGPEIAFLRDCLHQLGCRTRVVDIGLLAPPAFAADISREVVAARMDTTVERLLAGSQERVAAMTLMARGVNGLLADWLEASEVAGVIAVGGGVGTWVGTTVMRALPIGLPKIMVSTLPFDIRPQLGAKDIVVFPSVADILGLNPTLRTVLRNAAAALAGMAALPRLPATSKKVIGMTGMGITTPAVLASRKFLEEGGVEVTSFHTNGRGGSVFEEWIQMGMFSGVLDLTTHEITSRIFNGIALAEETRLETAAKQGVPQVVGPGGLDVISRGPVETLDANDRRRPHYRHSPFFTHVRISPEGMRAVAATVAQKMNLSRAPTVFAIPLQGFSEQSRSGGAVCDPVADEAFVVTLKQRLRQDIRVVEIDAHINDEAFARRACALLQEIMD
ncbi:MAG: Tm-1-like ATP-binding domain-containing protein [Desulfobacterales bacterium]|nr:MAG: Tm-1-like ATP-binding domain-containing protein [Desulfobacterales bacterium]